MIETNDNDRQSASPSKQRLGHSWVISTTCYTITVFGVGSNTTYGL